MSKNRGVNSKGPKYTRYFFAYSDRMILSSLLSSTEVVLAISGEPFGGQISLNNEILAIEFPQTTGDANGKYGVLLVPSSHISDFIKGGPQHKNRHISPRELNPSENGLVYLADFSLNRNVLGDLGEDVASGCGDNRLMPYRMSAEQEDISVQLNKCGYPNTLSFAYTKYTGLGLQMMGFQTKEPQNKIVKGIEQNPKIHFHKINSALEGSLSETVSKFIEKTEEKK